MSELRFMTAGESHGPRLTAILEGLPAGLKLEKEDIDKELARRQQGYGRGGRMKIETDRVEVTSGVRFGETLGGPITLRVVNADHGNCGSSRSCGFDGDIEICSSGCAGYIGALQCPGNHHAGGGRRCVQGLFAGIGH